MKKAEVAIICSTTRTLLYVFLRIYRCPRWPPVHACFKDPIANGVVTTLAKVFFSERKKKKTLIKSLLAASSKNWWMKWWMDGIRNNTAVSLKLYKGPEIYKFNHKIITESFHSRRLEWHRSPSTPRAVWLLCVNVDVRHLQSHYGRNWGAAAHSWSVNP